MNSEFIGQCYFLPLEFSVFQIAFLKCIHLLERQRNTERPRELSICGLTLQIPAVTRSQGSVQACHVGGAAQFPEPSQLPPRICMS